MTYEEALNAITAFVENYACGSDLDGLRMAIEALKERPHGEWIRYTEDGFDYAKCSACQWDSGEAFEYVIDRFPFCPNCGADMKEGEVE